MVPVLIDVQLPALDGRAHEVLNAERNEALGFRGGEQVYARRWEASCNVLKRAFERVRIVGREKYAMADYSGG